MLHEPVFSSQGGHPTDTLILASKTCIDKCGGDLAVAWGLSFSLQLPIMELFLLGSFTLRAVSFTDKLLYDVVTFMTRVARGRHIAQMDSSNPKPVNALRGMARIR